MKTEIDYSKYQREGYEVLNVTIADKHSKSCFKGDILVLYRNLKKKSIKCTIAGNIYD